MSFDFYALLAALIKAADTDNLERLRQVFPEQVQEVIERRNAPYAILPAQDKFTVEQYLERNPWDELNAFLPRGAQWFIEMFGGDDE